MKIEDVRITSECGPYAPPKPAITATRMKGEDITELRPIVVGQKPGKVLLELTLEAAAVLHLVCGYIGGSPEGPRGRIDEIRVALNQVGIHNADVFIRGDIRLA